MKKMNEERTNESDTLAAIGIGAMIVFIALVLVAAVASAVIIQTGEKLQQNAQQTGSDTQQEIGGKISVIAVWVGDQASATAEEITIVFEPAAGSEPITDTNVLWNVVCDGGAAASVAMGDFAAATDLDDATDPGVFAQGNVYMVHIAVGNAAAANDCPPPATGTAEHMLLIMVEGGGTTYETLLYTSNTQGAAVV